MAASFDCSKAVTAVEKIVCSTPEISKLDDALAAAYKVAQDRSSDKAALAHDQRLWLAQRNSCGNNGACIKSSYEARLKLISAAPEPTTTPLTTIAEIASFSPADYPIASRGGKLIFSQFDKSGNNYDIVAFDIADQSSEYLLKGGLVLIMWREAKSTS